MHVRLAVANDHARWNGYVDRHPDASIYHRWEWGEIYARTYGTRAAYLLAEDQGRVVGVLPMIALGPPGRRRHLVAMPYFGHGGAIGDSPAAWTSLLDAARAMVRDARVTSIELRHAHAVPDAALPARTDKVLMHRTLPATADELSAQVGSKLRNDVRRPQREGMVTEIGGRALVSEFHSVYASVMRDLGSPCHARSLFERILEIYPDRAFIARVSYQGRTIGAAFLIGQGTTVEVPCAGTLHAFNRLRANMLLYWAALSEAIARGYGTFSFGRSSADAGTYSFKKSWGATPVPLPYHYLQAHTAAPPTAHRDNPLLARAASAWTRLPLPLTKVLGPQIVRHLA